LREARSTPSRLSWLPTIGHIGNGQSAAARGLVEARGVAVFGEIAAEHEQVGRTGRAAQAIERRAEATVIELVDPSFGANPIWMSVICAISIDLPPPAAVPPRPPRTAILTAARSAALPPLPRADGSYDTSRRTWHLRFSVGFALVAIAALGDTWQQQVGRAV
jgi:hypothetical protein